MPVEGPRGGSRTRDNGSSSSSSSSRDARPRPRPSEAPAATLTSTSRSTRDDSGWQEVGGKTSRRYAGARNQQQQQQQQQRPSSKPQAKPATAVGATRGGMGDGKTNTNSTTTTTSSRQHPARSASRREYTLFDHLLTTTGAPPSRRSQADGPSSLTRGGRRTPSSRRGEDDGTPAGPGPPATRSRGTPTPVSAAPPSGTRSRAPQRGPASQQARQGVPSRGERGDTARQGLRGAGGAAVDGGVGGRFEKAGPSPPTSSARQRGGDAPPTRAATKDSDAPRPGKQRLGPRKKKLSTLKKKILLDRLEKWRTIQQQQPLAAAPPIHAGEQERLVQEQASASLLPPSRTLFGGDGESCGAGVSAGGGSGGIGGQTRLWVVAIYNLVDEEDVEDGDDHAEIERDLCEMASAFGEVRSVEVPRGAAHFDGTAGLTAAAKVAFASAEEAQRAKRGFDGRLVGGKSLRVDIEDSDKTLGVENEELVRGNNPGAPLATVWRVAVENLIDEEDDLDNDDEYAEVCADVSAMMEAHGTLIEVDIPRGKDRKSEKAIVCHTNDGTARVDQPAAAAAATVRRVVVVTYGSQAEAEACAKDNNGRSVGGKELRATIIVRQPRAGPQSSRLIAQPLDDGSATLSPAGREGSAERPGAATATKSPSADASTAAATPAGSVTRTDAWRVVIRNLIDQDDLIDDDDYDEVLSDATALVSAYGAVIRLCIPRDRKSAAVEEEAGTYGGAEPGEAVAVFGSLGEAEACARGLGGRKIAGKFLEAQISSKTPPSQPGVRTGTGADPGDTGSDMDRRSMKGAPPHGGRPSAPPDGHDSGSGVVRGVGSPAAGARAAIHPSGGVGAPAFVKGGKRMPTKYTEAAALPKPPGVSGGALPNAYVSQSPDKEVDDLVFEMLQLLFKFQERARLADPAKSKTRRRIVMGLREVLRGIKAKKVRLLIVAPNVDGVGGEGGLDEKVVEIIDVAREGETPVVFALSKRRIGKALGKTIKVSAVGVYSFDGAHEQHKQLKRRIEATHSLPQPSPLGVDPT
eukprot:g7580.t1